MLLLTLILIPLIAAALVTFVPRAMIRGTALLGTLIPLGLWVANSWGLDWAGGSFHDFALSAPWFPQLGISFKLALDPVSAILMGLTLLLGPICVVGSYTAISERERTYYAWLLILQSAMTGVFCARDAVLFYIFFEFTLVPMFVLISLFGSTNRKAAAIKFFLYTFTGSIIALAGIVYVAWWHASTSGGWTFDLARLREAANAMSLSQQRWVFGAMLCGFAVKVPLFPLHTWLPLAHTEAPTAGSVVLAGVLLKLGTYAIFAIAIPFCPLAAIQLSPLLATIAVIGIIYGGLICWVQTDVKKLVAYSSVAHLGFCMLGLFALNRTGVQGSVLYMVNHGLSTGALFLCIGMIYERYHTRSMKEIGGLAARMPVWSTFMVFFAMASVGLPGLNGFVSEFLCLFATFQAGKSFWWDYAGAGGHFTAGNLGPVFALVAGTGMIIAAMYTLYMVGRVVWGPLKEPAHDDAHTNGHTNGHARTAHAHAHAHHAIKDLSPREIGVLVPLALLCLGLGVYPKILTDAIAPQAASLTALIDAQRPRLSQDPATVQVDAPTSVCGSTQCPAGCCVSTTMDGRPLDATADNHPANASPDGAAAQGVLERNHP